MGMAISPSEQAAVDSADTEGLPVAILRVVAIHQVQKVQLILGVEMWALTEAGLIFKEATFPEDYC